MNKKGFTLVEILATISILSLIMIIVATKGFGVFDSTKGKINNLNKENLIKIDIFPYYKTNTCSLQKREQRL